MRNAANAQNCFICITVLNRPHEGSVNGERTMRKLTRTLLVVALSVNVAGCSLLTNSNLSPATLLRHVTDMSSPDSTSNSESAQGTKQSR